MLLEDTDRSHSTPTSFWGVLRHHHGVFAKSSEKVQLDVAQFLNSVAKVRRHHSGCFATSVCILDFGPQTTAVLVRVRNQIPMRYSK